MKKVADQLSLNLSYRHWQMLVCFHRSFIAYPSFVIAAAFLYYLRKQHSTNALFSSPHNRPLHRSYPNAISMTTIAMHVTIPTYCCCYASWPNRHPLLLLIQEYQHQLIHHSWRLPRHRRKEIDTDSIVRVEQRIT